MFMDEGKAARSLPCESIIKEVKEIKEGKEVKEEKEVKEVKEGTQGNLLARGAAEKMCYDANRRICVERQGEAALAASLVAQTTNADA
jgi:hypothetical protein